MRAALLFFKIFWNYTITYTAPTITIPHLNLETKEYYYYWLLWTTHPPINAIAIREGYSAGYPTTVCKTGRNLSINLTGSSGGGETKSRKRRNKYSARVSKKLGASEGSVISSYNEDHASGISLTAL